MDEVEVIQKWVDRYLEETENEAGRLERTMAHAILHDLALYVRESQPTQ